MDVPLLPTLAKVSETNEKNLKDLIEQSVSPSVKKYDFFILYNSTGLNGPLPDARFAEHLQTMLEEEKLTNGRQVRVVKANETDNNVQEVLQQMSRSVVVLVIFSEAALSTFAGDGHRFAQNNYLLYLQFALKLHHKCGVRMLGLNVVAVDNSGVPTMYMKCEGWNVTFNNVAHHSEWIQDSISASMNEIFAIQGVHIDLDDWDYKIHMIFATLYEMQDELYATKWASTFKIIPWKSVLGLIGTFLFCLFCPIVGYSIVACCMRFVSSASQQYKRARLNVALFGTGFNFLFVGTLFFVLAIFSAANGALCSSVEKCQLLVRTGARWSLWRITSATYCNAECYKGDPNLSYYASYTDDCASCVCDKLQEGVEVDPDDIFAKKCSSGVEFAVVCCVLFVIGLYILAKSSSRFRRQSSEYVMDSQKPNQSSAISMQINSP